MSLEGFYERSRRYNNTIVWTKNLTSSERPHIFIVASNMSKTEKRRWGFRSDGGNKLAIYNTVRTLYHVFDGQRRIRYTRRAV